MNFLKALQEVLYEFDSILKIENINDYTMYTNKCAKIIFKEFEFEFWKEEQVCKQALKKFLLDRSLAKSGKVLNPNSKACDFGIGKDVVNQCYSKMKKEINKLEAILQHENEKKRKLLDIKWSIERKTLTAEEIISFVHELSVSKVIES